VDVPVSNLQEYLAALTNPAATTLIFTNDITITSPMEGPLLTDTSRNIALQGQLGQGGARPVFDASNQSRFFRNLIPTNHPAGSGNDLEYVRNLIIRNGRTITNQVNGGAIYVGQWLLDGVHDSDFLNNVAGNTGGAISVSVVLQDMGAFRGGVHRSKFIGNETLTTSTGAQYGGGAIYVNGRFEGDVVDSEFSNNRSASSGGAIRVRTFDGDIRGSRFAGNTAVGTGGALSVANTMTGTISDSLFSNNRADDLGGALDYRPAQSIVAVHNTLFANNRSKVSGGAIDGFGQTDVANTVFFGNQATGELLSAITPGTASGVGGAGLFRGNASIENSVFFGNIAKAYGAAIHYHPITAIGLLPFVVSATGGNTTQFYGNLETDTGRYSSIYFSTGAPDPLNPPVGIHADTNSRVLMLDAMQTNTAANLTVNLNKTGAGDWFLGGANNTNFSQNKVTD